MDIVSPNWACNFGVRAFTTTRDGGRSSEPFSSLNLGLHVGDDSAAVEHNRKLCLTNHALPHLPHWLRQVHGTRIINATDLNSSFDIEADAMYTRVPDHVCGILTADCLPIVICDERATEVAAVHAGWRGLLQGVVASSLRKFSTPAAQLIAWIGPGIGSAAYIVDPIFRRRFLDADPAFDAEFRYNNGHWHADLYGIAERRLRSSGVKNVSRYDGCTFAEPKRFYSYRRDGVTGRMATFAWIDSGRLHRDRPAV